MIEDIFEKIELNIKRANQALSEIKDWKSSLDSSIFEDFEKVKTIDTFIYRFIKVQDMIQDKLFKAFLDFLGEYKENLSFLDMLDRLEKLGFIKDVETWMGYRKLRNKLTHEYPNKEDDVIEGIRLAMDAFVEMVSVVEKIKKDVKEKKEKIEHRGNS